jgi:hypothetical protein
MLHQGGNEDITEKSCHGAVIVNSSDPHAWYAVQTNRQNLTQQKRPRKKKKKTEIVLFSFVFEK